MNLRSTLVTLVSLVGAGSMLACGEPSPAAVDDPPAPAAKTDVPASDSTGEQAEPSAFPGFSWVRPNLAGMPLPGRRGDLDADLKFVADQDVKIVVSLTVTALPEATITELGMRLIHIPVIDGQAPTQAQIDEFVTAVTTAGAANQKLVVHCLAGLGRTGTMLSAWFISTGKTTAEALEEIRELRPGSVETAVQERALQEYESRIHGTPGDGPQRIPAP